MAVTLGGVIILLLTAAALLSRKVAIMIFLFSIPLKELIVLDLFGRAMRPNEVVIFALGLHALYIVVTQFSIEDGKRIMTSGRFVSIGLFGIICVISTLYAFINPPEGVTVHPYNIDASFGAFAVTELELGRNNITQLIMRLFFLGAFVVVALTFKEEDIVQGIRWIVYGALAGGVIGIAYQVSVALESPAVPYFMQEIGFNRFAYPPTYAGPLPRMFSIQGEPGTVANMLLFALALLLVSVLAVNSRPIFSKVWDIVIVFMLWGLILLSTGTTGYGGLIILAGVLGGAVVAYQNLSIRRYLTGMILVVGVSGISIVILWVLGFDIVSALSYQTSKLQFSAHSGSIRIRYLLLELELVSHRPLLGIGVGSHQSTSVFGTIVTDVGLVGLAVFCAMNLWILAECLLHPRQIDGHPISAMLFVAGLTLFLTNFLARDASSLYFGWYWVAIGWPLVLHRQRILGNKLRSLQRMRPGSTTRTWREFVNR